MLQVYYDIYLTLIPFPVSYTLTLMSDREGGEMKTCTMGSDCLSGEPGYFTVPSCEDDILVCADCWFDDSVYGGGMERHLRDRWTELDKYGRLVTN